MPTCPTCHIAAVTAAQSSAAVRDIGIVGVLSMAAMPALAMRRKRTAADLRATGRTKPDGTLLQWKMTDLAMAREDGILPFFIDWGDTPHPGGTAPSGCTLEELRLWHPQAAAMQRILQRLGIAAEIREGPAAVEAVIRSPRGLVTLR